MIRWIRNKLREIEYHSANRKTTVWARATFLALLLAFALAWPAMWIVDRMVVVNEVHATLEGTLLEIDGQPAADLQAAQNWNYSYGPGIEVVGTFKVVLAAERHGWPLNSSTRRLPPRGELDLYRNSRSLTDVTLDETDPMHRAILVELHDEQAAFDAWHRGIDGDVNWHVLSASMSAVIWMIILATVFRIMLAVARLLVLIVSRERNARRTVRVRKGLCHRCGYNLHGLDFHERCPECGTAVAW